MKAANYCSLISVKKSQKMKWQNLQNKKNGQNSTNMNSFCRLLQVTSRKIKIKVSHSLTQKAFQEHQIQKKVQVFQKMMFDHKKLAILLTY